MSWHFCKVLQNSFFLLFFWISLSSFILSSLNLSFLFKSLLLSKVHNNWYYSQSKTLIDSFWFKMVENNKIKVVEEHYRKLDKQL